ncbi:MAG: glycine zipper 2TM domain-containing protein [Betaproteobacteria bacterium]|nr:glycine zipper 2TM domain-containing protein [Betaproteobacteria bacterium]
MNKTILIWTTLAAAALVLSGCATSQSASSYSQAQTQREMNVRMGVVESVRSVTIEGNKSGAGTAVGGVIGGIAGSNVGGGERGSAVGTILGAVGGAVAGHALEENVSKKAGLEITVKFDNGTISAIIQEADEQFHVGDRVRVLSGGGKTRVTH